MVNKTLLSFDEVIVGLETIGPRIEKENFDTVIAVSRGGLVVAGLLTQLISCRDVRSIAIKSYKGDKKVSDPEVISSPGEIKGKVLIVDDVTDTGSTIETVLKIYPKAKTFTLHYKPGSVFKPDFFLWVTTDWIVYPWEFNEK